MGHTALNHETFSLMLLELHQLWLNTAMYTAIIQVLANTLEQYPGTVPWNSTLEQYPGTVLKAGPWDS
jgi:hypothetical protein